MPEWLVFAAIAGALFAVFVAALYGWQARRPEHAALRARVKELPRERRRAIARALRRGEAVGDPRDAPLAIELAERTQRMAVKGRLTGRLAWATHVGLAFIVVVAIARDQWIHAVVLVIGAVSWVGSRFWLRRLVTNAERAELRNRELAAQTGTADGRAR
jgi:Flp pilus assembly protein TadB